jgi:hypothetical protein
MRITPYGPGDPETWGPCNGHPLDPRTPEAEEAEPEPEPGITYEEVTAICERTIRSCLEDAEKYAEKYPGNIGADLAKANKQIVRGVYLAWIGITFGRSTKWKYDNRRLERLVDEKDAQ